MPALIGARRAGLSAFPLGAVPGPFPAPAGYRWQYVFEGADPVYEGGERVVELVVI